MWPPQGRLADFSFAGYRRGEEPLSTVPPGVSVKQFGAQGDGQSDDTQAFLDVKCWNPPPLDDEAIKVVIWHEEERVGYRLQASQDPVRAIGVRTSRLLQNALFFQFPSTPVQRVVTLPSQPFPFIESALIVVRISAAEIQGNLLLINLLFFTAGCGPQGRATGLLQAAADHFLPRSDHSAFFVLPEVPPCLRDCPEIQTILSFPAFRDDEFDDLEALPRSEMINSTKRQMTHKSRNHLVGRFMDVRHNPTGNGICQRVAVERNVSDRNNAASKGAGCPLLLVLGRVGHSSGLVWITIHRCRKQGEGLWVVRESRNIVENDDVFGMLL